jgi:hypothetical protein
MTTHTTSTLKDLIKVKMHPANEMTIPEIDNWNSILPEITGELIKHINFFAYSIFRKPMVKRQLRQIQAECTSLLNVIDKYNYFSEEMISLKKNTVNCLSTILYKIVKDCEPYADLTANVNYVHFSIELDTIQKNILETTDLIHKVTIAPELKDLVMDCFNKFSKGRTASYDMLKYIIKFQLDLMQLLKTYNQYNLNNALSKYLVDHHYNTKLFINYLNKELEKELSEITDLQLRLSFLFRKKTTIMKRSPTVKKPKFLRQDPSIYDGLMDFINAEISCLGIAIKKARRTIVPILAPVPVPYCPPDYKLRFNFSVESLAYLIKLLVNVNVIEPGVKAELLRYVAANFQTPGTKSGGIAAGSFQTKYKNVTQSTSVTVRAALMAMLKLVDKEF